MVNKKGQFYLIAAIVVVGLVVAFIGVTNFSNKEEKTRAQSIFNQLEIETQKILEFGAVNGAYPWDAFAKNFSNYAGQEINIDFVVVNNTATMNYECFRYYANGTKINLVCSENSGEITLSETFNNFVFDIKKGQNIYFVVFEESDGERYVFAN